jgi:antirestriction protein ArdC
MTTTTRGDVYDATTAKMIEALERGVTPWHKPWAIGVGRPRSMSTGKAYRGVNVLLLGFAAQDAGYTSEWWGTYRQMQERGGQVRRGERSTEVLLWKPVTRRGEDENGEERTGGYLLARSFRVFNAEQCDGLEALAAAPREAPAATAADDIAAAYLTDGPSLTFGGDVAAYSPARDAVMMPRREAFAGDAEYFSTLFHELTHSTGHASRLARDGVTEGHTFGDAEYSREELIAEMGAAMLCALAGVDNAAAQANSAAYLASWIRTLRGDHKLIIQAAANAQRAADLIAGADAGAGLEAAA